MGFLEYIAANRMIVNTREDNQEVFILAKNPQLINWSKHIDVAFHYIQDLYEKQQVAIIYAPTDIMAADGLIKPLLKGLFDRFRSQVGMKLGTRKKRDGEKI